MKNVPAGFVIPDFGDSPAPPTDPTVNLLNKQRDNAAESAPVPSGAPAGRRKMVLICSKGNLDMAYPGMVLANAAAGEGIETHIFFTFWGLDIINKKTNNNLQFTMIGNTAMHMPQLGDIKSGLEYKSMPQWMGRIPGMTSLSTKMMKQQMKDLEIPTIPEFLDLLEASGVHLWACRMSFDMMKMLEADLHPGVEGVISATDFMELSEGAQTLFI